jgi:hypothetical protein
MDNEDKCSTVASGDENEEYVIRRTLSGADLDDFAVGTPALLIQESFDEEEENEFSGQIMHE